MTIQEWGALTGAPNISPEEWDIVHDVYQWHPMISEVHGKQDLLKLYELGGMPLIRELHVTASSVFKLDRELQRQKKIKFDKTTEGRRRVKLLVLELRKEREEANQRIREAETQLTEIKGRFRRHV